MYRVLCATVLLPLLICTILGGIQLQGHKSLRQQSYNIVCIIYSDSCNYSSSSMLFNSTMVKFSFVCTATSLAVIKNSHSWFSGPEQPKHLTNQQNN